MYNNRQRTNGHPTLTRKQAFNVSGIPVSTITPGSSYINAIEFLYPWNTSTRVIQIPAGERFDLVVNYQCINTKGSVFDPWSACIVFWTDELDVIYDATGSILLGMGHYFNNITVSGAEPTRIADNIARIANSYRLKMPAHDVVFHFNMFANDDATPAVQVPDFAQWAVTR